MSLRERNVSPRVLITGGTGLLGKSLLEAAPTTWAVWATMHRCAPPEEWRQRFVAMDVCEEASIRHAFGVARPHVVIHAASIGSVDQAEREPDLVRRVNVDGTAAVGRACASHQARLVFISSNAVFDGRHPPYAEDAPLRAVNRYGAFKIEAEAWVRASGLPHVILRPILMYGWPWPGGRDNVVTRWLSRLEQGQGIEVAGDIYSMPLLAANAAEAVWAAVVHHRGGTYHLAGAERLTLAEFARATARAFQCDEALVTSVPGERLVEFAARPKDTSFVTTRMVNGLGVRPVGIREGLATLRRLRLPA